MGAGTLPDQVHQDRTGGKAALQSLLGLDPEAAALWWVLGVGGASHRAISHLYRVQFYCLLVTSEAPNIPCIFTI